MTSTCLIQLNCHSHDKVIIDRYFVSNKTEAVNIFSPRKLNLFSLTMISCVFKLLKQHNEILTQMKPLALPYIQIKLKNFFFFNLTVTDVQQHIYIHTLEHITSKDFLCYLMVKDLRLHILFRMGWDAKYL